MEPKEPRMGHRASLRPLRAGLLLVLLLLAPLALRAQAVVFSHPGGFYADTFSLALSLFHAVPPHDSLAIHFTLNGNEPTECDPLYHSPLPLGPDCYSPSSLFRVPSAPASRWYAPEAVERIIVVRAAAFDSAGFRRSPVATAAFIIDSLLHRHISLPVVSLCADSLSLFSADTGIFLPGACFDSLYPNTTGNYFMKGRLWERPAAFAYYEPDGGATLEQDCGLRAHGNSQRLLPQKGLSLYARRQYGDSRFRHAFFDNRRQSAYRRLVLRPWSTSWSGAGIEDWLCQRLADPLRCDNLASRPVVLFLNGEYWGIYFLEEKADEHFLEERHGVPADSVDLLAYWGDDVEHGSPHRWRTFYQWLQQADLDRPQDLRRLAAEVDTAALMDYMLLQVLILNDDWPVSNERHWASNASQWRWIFFDADGALSSFPDNAAILDYMTYRSPRPTTHTTPQATLLFRRLLAHRPFLEASLARLATLVEHHFAYPHAASLLGSVVAAVEDEVPHQIARFDSPSSMVRWRMAIATIDDFLRTEPQAMVNEYAQYFGLDKPASHSGTVFDRYGHPLASGPLADLRRQLPPGIYFVRQDGGAPLKWIVNNP